MVTTIEQSKELFDLGLKVSTADMCYIKNPNDEYRIFAYSPTEAAVIRDAAGYTNTIYPAWSLNALLELMKNPIKKDGYYYELTVYYCGTSNEWEVGYITPDMLRTLEVFNGDTLIDGVYKLMVCLIKGGYMESHLINVIEDSVDAVSCILNWVKMEIQELPTNEELIDNGLSIGLESHSNNNKNVAADIAIDDDN